uniref:Uncharacterized protein n=1 Tax=Anopheles farauti TaxID=69004 RepID=A0A182QQQ0_9DIPT
MLYKFRLNALGWPVFFGSFAHRSSWSEFPSAPGPRLGSSRYSTPSPLLTSLTPPSPVSSSSSSYSVIGRMSPGTGRFEGRREVVGNRGVLALGGVDLLRLVDLIDGGNRCLMNDRNCRLPSGLCRLVVDGLGVTERKLLLVLLLLLLVIMLTSMDERGWDGVMDGGRMMCVNGLLMSVRGMLLLLLLVLMRNLVNGRCCDRMFMELMRGIDRCCGRLNSAGTSLMMVVQLILGRITQDVFTAAPYHQHAKR